MTRLACAAVILCAIAAPNAPAQWSIQDSHTTADLRGIHSIGNGIAWASGTEGTVLRTINDGKDWQRCATPPDADHLDFRGIQAFDANTAIVMSIGKGPLSRLYKTTDACRTWKLLFTNPDPEGFWDSVYFPKEQRSISDHEGFGLLLGDPVDGRFAVYETRDGSYSWQLISNDILKVAGEGAGAFAASNSCISGFGGATFDFVVGGTSGSALIRLSYRGDYWLKSPSTLERSWTKDVLPLAKGSPSSGAFSIGERVQFLPNNPAPDLRDLRLIEVVVGGDYSEPDNPSGTAAAREPGTKIWQRAQTQPHGFRSAVAYGAASKTWITVGPNGTDISADDGRNWHPLRPGPRDAPDSDQHWNALSLPFVVGPHGRIGKLEPEALSK